MVPLALGAGEGPPTNRTNQRRHSIVLYPPDMSSEQTEIGQSDKPGGPLGTVMHWRTTLTTWMIINFNVMFDQVLHWMSNVFKKMRGEEMRS